MKIGAIVQARMSSKRFAGKVLYPIAGKPMLQYLLERLDRCAPLVAVVVATSVDESDTPIETLCRVRGVHCYRGSLLNVASRFRAVLDAYRFDAFVRVSGDSPLLDPNVVGRGVEMFLSGDFDLVTNVFPRSYPRGQSVEVIRADAFSRSADLMRGPDELEHVTPFFYRNREGFRIVNFSAERDYSGMDLSVDTPDDMNRVAAIVAAMTRPHWEYGLPEIREIYETVLSGARPGQ